MIVRVRREGALYEFEVTLCPLSNGKETATHSAQVDQILQIKAVLGEAADEIARIMEAHFGDKRIG